MKILEEKESCRCSVLAKLLHENTAILAALGDETTQHVLIQMLLYPACEGLRIGEIARIASLSRASASRHVQALMNAGLLSMRKEGTRHYYHFTEDTSRLLCLRQLLSLSIEILDDLSAKDSRGEPGSSDSSFSIPENPAL